MPKRIKEKSPTRFCFAPLSCVALPNAMLRGYFLNAGAKVPQDHKQWLMGIDFVGRLPRCNLQPDRYEREDIDQLR